MRGPGAPLPALRHSPGPRPRAVAPVNLEGAREEFGAGPEAWGADGVDVEAELGRDELARLPDWAIPAR
jgi:hypothetical protein